jgi:hypothetical protein
MTCAPFWWAVRKSQDFIKNRTADLDLKDDWQAGVAGKVLKMGS